MRAGGDARNRGHTKPHPRVPCCLSHMLVLQEEEETARVSPRIQRHQ